MKKIAMTILFAGSTLLMADGAALFVKCAGCHGKDGQTVALGKADKIAGKPVDELIRDIEGYKAGTQDEHGMGKLMNAQVKAYSAEDIKAVAEYIHGLK